MGIPILTSEGFVGQRWIVDDYFQAGETLHAGDVVGIKQDSESRGNHPKVFKMDGSVDKRRVIGVVHTPSGRQVGDQVATTGTTAAEDDYVGIVTKGIAKALSNGSIGVGDPVIPAGDTGTGPGSGSVARVAQSTGNSDSKTGAGESHTHTAGDVGLVADHAHLGSGTTGTEAGHTHAGAGDHEHDLGATSTPISAIDHAYDQLLWLEKSGNPGHGWQGLWVGAEAADDVSERLKTFGQIADHDHGSGSSHSHSSGGVANAGSHEHSGQGDTGDESTHKHTIDRAIVVGKCLTPTSSTASPPHVNQVIDILVDIAG